MVKVMNGMKNKTKVKIGDRIKILAASDGATGANDCIGTILSLFPDPDIKTPHGTGRNDTGIIVRIKDCKYGGGIWNIGPNPTFELIETEWDEENNV